MRCTGSVGFVAFQLSRKGSSQCMTLSLAMIAIARVPAATLPRPPPSGKNGASNEGPSRLMIVFDVSGRGEGRFRYNPWDVGATATAPPGPPTRS